MHKRAIHHLYKKLKPISYWYFLAALVLSVSVAVFALRSNNLNAVKLRTTLYSVDKQNGDVSAALNNLRKYIYSHMNTNLASGENAIYPPIQLKYTYQRLEASAQAAASAQNSQLYTNAEYYCQAAIPNGFSGRYRISCIESYITSHGTIKPQAIPAGLYEFDFQSPFWTPDLAGWSIVLSAIFLLLFVVRLALEKWLKSKLAKKP